MLAPDDWVARLVASGVVDPFDIPPERTIDDRPEHQDG